MRERSELDTAIGLEALQALTERAQLERPWLSGLCELVMDEIDLLDRRGVSSASRLDLAADVGMAVLDMIAEREDEEGRASGLPE